jgi:DNA polymerase IIIc chi subunit
VVIKAGETRKIDIVVDVRLSATTGNDEFAIELIDVVTDVNVD